MARSAIGWLVLLPVGVVLAVQIYRRRQPIPMRAWQGAKLGAFAGLLSVGFLALFLAAEARIDPATYGQAAAEITKKLQEQQATDPQPGFERVIQALSDRKTSMWVSGFFQITAAMLVLPLVGGISGAVAAGLIRPRTQ